MRSNLKHNLFEFSVFLAVILFFILSVSVNKVLELVLFIILVIFISILFQIFNYSLKVYLSTVIIVLTVLSVLISILSQGLINIGTLIPILGALVGVIEYIPIFKKKALFMESVSLVEMNKFLESLAISDKILESYPEYFNTIYFKACTLNILRKHQEQLELVDELLKMKLNKKQKMFVLNLKVCALSNLGRYDDAEDIVDEILEEDPDNSVTMYYEAEILLKIGYKQEAMDYYVNSLESVNNELLKHHKSLIKKMSVSNDNRNRILLELWTLKGCIQIKLHQYPEALDSFSEALKLNPNKSMGWNNKGYTLAKLGQYDEALNCIDRSLDLYPENDFALNSKGYILAESGKPEESLQYYQKAIEIAPLDEERYYHKGKAYQKLQQYTEALKCYNKVLELNPNCEYAKKARDEVLNVMEN
ncbi:tetratricopeptide repeat protein [Methanobacterium congolense]|uniref:TPR repeat-containing protein MJ1345 n=1 Tax=Methanobacterium congolense TaxID=118062 RepID=A0A1D3L0N5_9EURY|nr:tetratricopeptide repeat protein [Methanobacterium congolense]SCG85221.1 TPR repeat-containing protein MJ1345 [Methanobacterium congolense]